MRYYNKYYVLSKLQSGTASEVIGDCLVFNSHVMRYFYLLGKSIEILLSNIKEPVYYQYTIYYCYVCKCFTFVKPQH